MLKIIRASSLPTYNDCARLAAASVRVIDKSRGEIGLYELPGTFMLKAKKRGRKAHVGTALHKGLEYILKSKLDGRTWTHAAAEKAMLDECESGFEETEPDDNIIDLDTARMVLRNMLPVAAKRADELTPVAVEVSMSRRITPDTIVEGHADLIAEGVFGCAVHDWKTTGANKAKPYTSQIGEYINLANETYGDIQEGYTETIQRLKTKKPTLLTTPYPVIEASKFAQATVERFSANVDRFVATGDPNSFNANPSSSLCGDKYCPLWGTDACTVGRAA